MQHVADRGRVKSWAGYAAQIVRSVAKEWSREPVRGDVEPDQVDLSGSPSRVSFDDMVLRGRSDPKVTLGKKQEDMMQAVTSGTNLDSLCGGNAKKLAKMRFRALRLAERIERARKNQA